MNKLTCNNRRGAMTVEFALTAPILFTLVLGAIEFSRANMLMHTTTVAATEAVRKAIIPGATAATVTTTAQTELQFVGIAAADVVVEPAIITEDTKLITVGIRVPLDSRNGYIMPRFFMGKDIRKVVSLPREAKQAPDMTSKIEAATETMLVSLDRAATADAAASAAASTSSNSDNPNKGAGNNSGNGNTNPASTTASNSGSGSGPLQALLGWLGSLL